MTVNKILVFFIIVTSFIVMPIQLITPFILGILMSIPIVDLILLLSFSFIWTVFFYAPLIGLSYIYDKFPILRIPVAFIGVPLALLGNTFTALIPSLGEKESRFEKMITCQTFPYTWRYTKLVFNKLDVDENKDLEKVIYNIIRGNALFRKYLEDRYANLITLDMKNK
ncbi:MAG: hypothetical protein EOL97_14925 [Spirochaetia bacterium]|nr:hypothetical protein [Spirochaetia bacterium]